MSSLNIPPLTGRRTTARRKPAGEEPRTARGTTTRRAISGEIMEEGTKTPAVRSTRKKVQLEEGEVVSETPAVGTNGRRKGVGVSTRRSNLKKEEEVSTVQRVYSTRRSTRLSAKKEMESIPMENEMNKGIKIDLGVSENDMGEVSENNMSMSGM